MKFIHISDLHFGKNLFGYSLIEMGDQPFWCEEFYKLVEREKVDAVVISGDVYDRSVPSKEAVNLLDSFLTKLSTYKIPVCIIAGNHDSATRLQFGSSLFEKENIYIAAVAAKEVKHVTLQDEYGPITFWLIPYVFPALIETILEKEDIESYDDAFKSLLKEQKISYEGRNVLLSHQTVTCNGVSPETDGSETVFGGIGGIDVKNYEGFDYVALGHIHASQKVKKETIRYAGSILCYHFSEVKKSHKGPVLVTLKEKGNFEYQTIELPVLHKMREIRGKYADILKEETENQSKQEYLRVVLEDEFIPQDARNALSSFFETKNSYLMEIVHEPKIKKKTVEEIKKQKESKDSIENLFLSFYKSRYNEEYPSEKDQRLISFLADEVRNAIEDEKNTEPKEEEIDKIIEFVKKENAK